MIFIILDFNADLKVPFILGRPFLAMRYALIKGPTRQLTMKAYDEKEIFDIYKAI